MRVGVTVAVVADVGVFEGPSIRIVGEGVAVITLVGMSEGVCVITGDTDVFSP